MNIVDRIAGLAIVCIACGPVAAAQSRAPRRIDLCEVRVRDGAELARLFAAARDPDDHFPVRDGVARIYSDPEEETRLANVGFDVRVVQPDLPSFYARRAALDPKRMTQGGSMGGFKTLAEIGAEMDRLATAHPSIVSPKFSIGTSIEGRPIWAMRISDNPTIDEPGEAVAEFDALHHAREPMSGEALLLFADELCTNYPADPTAKRLVETRDLLFIPCVNPDGYEYNHQTNQNGGGMWRKNRRLNSDGTHGVDLNRNYAWEWGPQWPGSSGIPGDDTYRGPSAFSEPETQAVRDFLTAHTPGMNLSAHTYGDLWLFPWGYTSTPTPDDATFRVYGQRATASNGWVYGPPPLVLYECNGISVDWSYGQLGIWAFSPEIGSSSDGFWPQPSRIQPLYQQVRPGLYQVAEYCGAWAERTGVTWHEVSGDGDALIERGETWSPSITIADAGIEPVSGTLHLSSSTPYVTVLQADVPFGRPAQTFSVTHLGGGLVARGAQPLGLEILIGQNAPAGTYSLDLSIVWDGISTPDTIPVVVH
jgi:hypothetical protein